MEFSGLLKKYHAKELKFLGVIKKNVGYVEFPGAAALVFDLGISKVRS